MTDPDLHEVLIPPIERPGLTIRPPLRHDPPVVDFAPYFDIVLSDDLAPFVNAERQLNDEAFETQYLEVKEWLFEQYAGRWIMIAGGEVFPRDADRRIRPAHTMDEAVAAGHPVHGDALHRYVFRVGEEGDARYHFTLSPYDDVAGRQFLLRLSPHTLVAPDGLYLRDVPLDEPGESTRVAGSRADGVFATVAFRPPSVAREAVDRKALMIDLHVATGFTGFATLSHEHGQRLASARWEIPGTIHVRGWPSMRRARVHATMAGTALEELITVAIRPLELPAE